MLAKFKIAAAVSISILASPASAQGVPTFDSQSILKEIAQLDQMLQDFGIQNEQLAELQNQLQVLQDQYDRLQEIQAALQDPTSLMSFVMGDGLDGVIETDFDTSFLDVIQSVQSGDYTGIASTIRDAVKADVEDAYTRAGTSATEVEALSTSTNPIAQRNAQVTASGAVTSAAAQVAHAEAGQIVERVRALVDDTSNMTDLKDSVDHNTRVTAEMAIALAALMQLESVQTMNVGVAGVADAATLADVQGFMSDFTVPTISIPKK